MDHGGVRGKRALCTMIFVTVSILILSLVSCSSNNRYEQEFDPAVTGTIAGLHPIGNNMIACISYGIQESNVNEVGSIGILDTSTLDFQKLTITSNVRMYDSVQLSDDRIVILTYDRRLLDWNASTGEVTELTKSDLGFRPYSMTLSSNAESVIIGTSTGELIQYDDALTTELIPLKSYPIHVNNNSIEIEIVANALEKLIASGHKRLFLENLDGLSNKIEFDLRIDQLDLHSNGKYLALTQSDRCLIFEINDDLSLTQLASFQKVEAMSDLKFHPTENILFYVGKNADLRSYDIESNTHQVLLKKEKRDGEIDYITAISFSADGRKLLIGRRSGRVHVFILNK